MARLPNFVDPATVTFVTVQELAAYARMSERTVQHHIDKGALYATRRGRRLYIAQAEALRYLFTGTQTFATD